MFFENSDPASDSGPTLPADHPTATVFLDESGVINTDRFFGIGCLRAVSGPALSRRLSLIRQQRECFDEIHWSGLNKAATRKGPAFDLAIAAVDAFFELDGLAFCCTVADRQNGDLVKGSKSGWVAYETLAISALDASVAEDEVVSVMADHVDTPARIRFEETVAMGLNDGRGRLAVTTVTRLHSHAVDGLQLADLLLGAVMFDFRRGADPAGLREDGQKAQLADYLLERCGIPTFRPRGKELPGKMKVEMRERKRTRRSGRGGHGRKRSG